MKTSDKTISSRKKKVGALLFLAMVVMTSLAILADQWRRDAVGIQVVISGIRIVENSQIRKCLELSDTARLADIDLMQIKSRIMTIPFIRDVVIRRDPPRTLVVEVLERTPAALVLDLNARDWLIDTGGIVLPMPSVLPIHDVPLLTGLRSIREIKPGIRLRDPVAVKALELLREIATADGGVADMISEIHAENPNDLVLYTLEGGVPIRFGANTNAQAKLKILKAFLETAVKQYDVSNIEYIDIRFKNQVVFRNRKEAIAATADSLRNEMMSPSLD